MPSGTLQLRRSRVALRRHGLGRLLLLAGCRAARRLTGVEVWNGVVVTRESLAPWLLQDPARVTGRFRERAELEAWAMDPVYKLDLDFIERATSLGDRCFAFAQDGVLLSYGWYARRSVELGPDLTLRFDPTFVCLYRAFTHPQFRGQRLPAVGVAVALEAYAREGTQGVVSCIDASNAAAMRSCAWMGCRTFGRVLLRRRGGAVRIHVSRGCERYGFRVEAGALARDRLRLPPRAVA